ncbi:hypothetical protein EON65_47515 [archaeon]|nr:MAG: hypothetical protein EON65_47515 [archaeon]
MPKLSKRKRQLKELLQARRSEDGALLESDGNSVNDETGTEDDEATKFSQSSTITAQVATGSVTVKTEVVEGRRSGNRAKNFNTTQSSTNGAEKSSNSNTSSSKEPVWAQCNNCDKWRSLPPTVDPNSLPDIWTCDMNIYDPSRANCDAPEEQYEKEEDQATTHQKAYLRLWLKRMRSADRAEARLNIGNGRGAGANMMKKKKPEIEWIRCSNPSCGKWRAISRNIDSNLLLSKLHKNRHFGEDEFGGGGVWYCSMNSWDETTASCAAPQDPLWNCPWNLK